MSQCGLSLVVGLIRLWTGKCSGLEAWLARVAQSVQRQWRDLFAKGSAVGILFHAMSSFENVATGRYDHGQFYVGHVYIPATAPYRESLQTLMSTLDASQY